MKKSAPPAIHRVPISEAGAHLDELVGRVHTGHGQYVLLERDGTPVAALIDPDEFDDYLDLQDPEVRQALIESEREVRAGSDGRPLDEFLDELQEQMTRE